MEILDKDSPIPLYFQMAEIIKDKIESSEWKIDHIIPSEFKLCEDFQISRGTVRQSINYLIQEGYLYKKQGLGTFVCKPKHLFPVSSFYCVGVDRNNQRRKLKRKILSEKIIKPNTRIKKIMNLNSDKELYRIDALLLIESIPLSLEEIYLLKDLFPNLKSQDITHMSPYEIFIREYNLKISEVRESFTIKKLDKTTSGKLGLHNGAYALLISRLSWSADTIFEFRQSIIRTDQCRYTVKLL